MNKLLFYSYRPSLILIRSLVKSYNRARIGLTCASVAAVCFLVHFSLNKQVPKNTLGAQTGDPLRKMLYASFLHKIMIFVKFGEPAVCRGPLGADVIFGCQLWGFVTLCLLGVASTPIVGLWGRFLIHSGGDEVVPELFSKSVGILLWRIEDLLARKSSYIVVNSHSMLTSLRGKCLDYNRTINSIDPLWIA